MANDKRIDNILRHLGELKDLLLVIDGQGENTPDVLYRLADEKAACITQSIWKLRDSRFWQRLDEFEDEEELVYDMEGTDDTATETIDTGIPSIPSSHEATQPETIEKEIILNKIAEEPELIPQETTAGTRISAPVSFTEQAPQDNSNITLEEVLQRRKAKDMRKAISLNDRFRFRKELFGNNDTFMGETLDALNNMESFEEAANYLSACCNDWDNENEAVTDFMNIVEKHFL